MEQERGQECSCSTGAPTGRQEPPQAGRSPHRQAGALLLPLLPAPAPAPRHPAGCSTAQRPAGSKPRGVARGPAKQVSTALTNEQVLIVDRWPGVVGYRHWTDKRDTVRSVLHTEPSHMMVRRLLKRPGPSARVARCGHTAHCELIRAIVSDESPCVLHEQRSARRCGTALSCTDRGLELCARVGAPMLTAARRLQAAIVPCAPTVKGTGKRPQGKAFLIRRQCLSSIHKTVPLQREPAAGPHRRHPTKEMKCR